MSITIANMQSVQWSSQSVNKLTELKFNKYKSYISENSMVKVKCPLISPEQNIIIQSPRTKVTAVSLSAGGR